MKNMANMLKQAQQMKKNMENVQKQMDALEVEGSAGNGLVSITMTGKSMVKSVSINPEAVDATDVETLEDLLMVAFNDAQSKVQDTMQSELQKATGGMSIPGLM